MLIIGAKGFAKEVLEVICQKNENESLAFFDDVSVNMPDQLYDRYKVLKNIEKAAAYFSSNDKRFTLGLGGTIIRHKLSFRFSEIGGVFTSTISPYAHIGRFGNKIGNGVNIMTGTVITNDVSIGKGVLINLNCTVGHDAVLGDFVELSPGVHISGNCKVGDFTTIGTNATILPKLTIGKNVIIAAGSVVTKDIPDNVMVAGVPAVIKKELLPIEV